jgi:oligopeptide/dipeptide ABC transporter ATP-binding protein
VLARPAHPYTAALLESVPQSSAREELRVIAGSPPPPTAVLPGCSFAPRCGWAVERCTAERPLLGPIGGGAGRAAACHRSREVLGA